MKRVQSQKRVQVGQITPLVLYNKPCLSTESIYEPAPARRRRILPSKNCTEGKSDRMRKGSRKYIPNLTQVSISVASHVAIRREEGERAALCETARPPFLVFTRYTRRGRERERGRCGLHAARDEAELKLPFSQSTQSQQILQSSAVRPK